MTDISNDETRLRATETQMRRALGLQQTPRSPGTAAPTLAPGGSPRPARRFVRDGEVAVSVYQHDAAAGTNQLETVRQAAQSEAVARGQAERRLAAAQETIRELQTQLAHERLAKDESVQRAAGEKLGHFSAQINTKPILSASPDPLATTRCLPRSSSCRQNRKAWCVWESFVRITTLEAGSLSQWLYARMREAGLSVELLETRHVRDAFKAMPVKTDRTDARGIPQLMRLGWLRSVHCRS